MCFSAGSKDDARRASRHRSLCNVVVRRNVLPRDRGRGRGTQFRCTHAQQRLTYKFVSARDVLEGRSRIGRGKPYFSVAHGKSISDDDAAVSGGFIVGCTCVSLSSCMRERSIFKSPSIRSLDQSHCSPLYYDYRAC